MAVGTEYFKSFSEALGTNWKRGVLFRHPSLNSNLHNPNPQLIDPSKKSILIKIIKIVFQNIYVLKVTPLYSIALSYNTDCQLH